MKEEKYQREIQKRERLMQIFILISGFFIAYSKDNIKELMVISFLLFIIFAILYLVFLTRTKNDSMINIYAFTSSYAFSLLLIFFTASNVLNPINEAHFIILFFAMWGIFTFTFLSPNTDKKLTDLSKKFDKFLTKHPKLFKATMIVISFITFGWLLYETIKYYLK